MPSIGKLCHQCTQKYDPSKKVLGDKKLLFIVKFDIKCGVQLSKPISFSSWLSSKDYKHFSCNKGSSLQRVYFFWQIYPLHIDIKNYFGQLSSGWVLWETFNKLFFQKVSQVLSRPVYVLIPENKLNHFKFSSTGFQILFVLSSWVEFEGLTFRLEWVNSFPI